MESARRALTGSGPHEFLKLGQWSRIDDIRCFDLARAGLVDTETHMTEPGDRMCIR